jgi:hypothetical protein
LTISRGITNFTSSTSIGTTSCFKIGYPIIICGMQTILGTCLV